MNNTPSVPKVENVQVPASAPVAHITVPASHMLSTENLIYSSIYSIIILLILLLILTLIIKHSWNYVVPSLFPTLNIQELTTEKALVLLVLVRFLFK
jgi:hypothetical protein